ncbi:MAG: HD domain-containing protein [Candidatus Liptonbacteria bacterium]|nr:HD domain-containing protein [Candidatus Liptonbacteria bacterium]
MLVGFPLEREKKLRSIMRYSKFEVMWYRPSLWEHAHRVSWIVEELAPIAKKHFKKFDGEKARVLALVHDDAEIVIGDIQAGDKTRMSKAKLVRIWKDESKAIQALARRYPKFAGRYRYRGLLHEALTRKSVEAQVVTYADKLDGYCESMHEVLAGNFVLLPALIFYAAAMPLFPSRFPLLKKFFSDTQSSLIDIASYNDFPMHRVKHYALAQKPHTRRSLVIPTEFAFYNRWRELNVEHWGKEGMRLLTKRRE